MVMNKEFEMDDALVADLREAANPLDELLTAAEVMEVFDGDPFLSLAGLPPSFDGRFSRADVIEYINAVKVRVSAQVFAAIAA